MVRISGQKKKGKWSKILQEKCEESDESNYREK